MGTMEELKLYSVSDTYIKYLRRIFTNVYSNKESERIHTRKYVGVVIRLEKYNYYIPMSSPKESDYQIAGHKRKIKKSIVPIIRMIAQNKNGEKELIGTLRISHMIPAPESELKLYDVAGERDHAYRNLVQNQIIFIRKNREKILANAKLIYKQKIENDLSAGYVKAALEYPGLEKLCDRFVQEKNGGNGRNESCL